MLSIDSYDRSKNDHLKYNNLCLTDSNTPVAMGKRIDPRSERNEKLYNGLYRVLFYELHKQVPIVCGKTRTMT